MTRLALHPVRAPRPWPLAVVLLLGAATPPTVAEDEFERPPTPRQRGLHPPWWTGRTADARSPAAFRCRRLSLGRQRPGGAPGAGPSDPCPQRAHEGIVRRPRGAPPGGRAQRGTRRTGGPSLGKHRDDPRCRGGSGCRLLAVPRRGTASNAARRVVRVRRRVRRPRAVRPAGQIAEDVRSRPRLFRHPCSFLISSPSFDALPEDLRQRFWSRLAAVLEAAPGNDGLDHLSADDRATLRSILAATKPGTPPGWSE